MRIDWWTLALQAANFLVLIWLLQHFLYRPVQGIIAERQQRTESVIAEANAARSAAEGLRHELEGQRAAIVTERERALEEAHARARQEAAALLEGARADAEKLLAEQRRRVEQERADAAEALRQEAIDLAVTIAQRLLATSSEAGSDGPLLRGALARLEALERARAPGADGPAGGRRGGARGDRGAARSGGERRCDPPPARAGGRRRRGASSPPMPALIAGAELHFPHTVVRHSWRDSLRELEEDLKRDGRTPGYA